MRIKQYKKHQQRQQHQQRQHQQHGGITDLFPPNIHQSIIDELIQEVYSYVTTGFEDDDDIPLTNQQFQNILSMPEIRTRLDMIVNELRADYTADPTVFPFVADAFREPLYELGVFNMLDRYRVPMNPQTEESEESEELEGPEGPAGSEGPEESEELMEQDGGYLEYFPY